MICIAANDFPEIFSAIQGTGVVIGQPTEPYVRRAELDDRAFIVADAGCRPEEIAAKTALLIKRYSLHAIIGVGAAVGDDKTEYGVMAVTSARASGKTRSEVALNLPDVLYGDPSLISVASSTDAYSASGSVASPYGMRHEADAYDDTSYALYASATILRVPALALRGITRNREEYSVSRTAAAAMALESALQTLALLPR